MSFQNFRLDSISYQPTQSPSYPPSAAITAPTPAPALASTSVSANTVQDAATRGAQRGPYGSGDMDDGYTLVFDNLEAFHVWREKEEEEKVVEFVKGDTHGSKAVPPRFKDHVKLICARHSRSGRKKYVKKYPERVRKVPSRKLDGGGCQASMSYKTYFDTQEVRVCYVSQHSHEIGLANLPFTRRGRRAQAAATKSASADANPPVPNASPSQLGGPSSLLPTVAEAAHPTRPQPELPSSSSSSSHTTLHSYPHFPSLSMPLPQGFGAPMSFPAPTSISAPAAGPSSAPAPATAAAPPPPPPLPPPLPSPLPFPAPSQSQATAVSTDRTRLERERWDRMEVLYQSIRNNARQFEYPAASVAALESVLMRMYFESPLSAPPPNPPPHPAYGGAPTVPLAQAAPQQQQPEDTAMGHEDQSIDSESDGDEEENEEIEAIC